MIDEKVDQLLQELQITNPERYELVQAARNAIYSVVPNATERVMYGGFMFSGDAQFCGVFAYREHVSVEFGRGCDLPDPRGVLEGSGKLRRHIRLVSIADITGKFLEQYVDAAYRNSKLT
ncbi:DUF1801 domain-containing protein [Chlorobium phaeobacteroides]|jgi:hypothetical protein|uniref:YdhG-like domain-containing protein n=1 Tax=Chlorobium phaeobacteroides (strain DSM 266 / SMG 266 / 2430) TaxID=290317 RepID=A1BH33_CHLPD|nr:DUF1801 domain-containing protein [Chlorobium phaeobacteroides]ABL65710.1 conserved hypothetical protein [Chlorobium phaeobacteroides DSM 266]MBV5326999.1 DUF1801 domain-containing protein [Chlorobium sp.]